MIGISLGKASFTLHVTAAASIWSKSARWYAKRCAVTVYGDSVDEASPRTSLSCLLPPVTDVANFWYD